jgi:hypothetical protein
MLAIAAPSYWGMRQAVEDRKVEGTEGFSAGAGGSEIWYPVI